jgi:hypothetical protein
VGRNFDIALPLCAEPLIDGKDNRTSVEKENRGWDLEARAAGKVLKLEVKGTSGTEAACQLTPNEYHAFSGRDKDYRLCIVCAALSKHPKVKPFAWWPELQTWSFEHEALFETKVMSAKIETQQVRS